MYAMGLIEYPLETKISFGVVEVNDVVIELTNFRGEGKLPGSEKERKKRIVDIVSVTKAVNLKNR